ncbi:beta-cyclopiazonate dehydrogenase [Rhypophila sp. PSN 637]
MAGFFFKFLLASSAFLPALSALLPESIATSVVHKDVAIVGGGASGSYAAIRLKEDYGKSIVLIEKEEALGGHVNTFTDPSTGKPVDFGVNVFNDWGPARAFFERMNVSVGAPVRPLLTSQYMDFKTGIPVAYTPASFADIIPAFNRFYAAVAPLESMMLPGYFNFPPPSQIPADLLIPFGEFIKKYQLETAVNLIFESTGLGVGDMVNTLTIWVLATFNTPMIGAFIGLYGTLTPTSGRNIELYEAVAARLASDVRYRSSIIQTTRSASGNVTLWVKNHATHAITLVKAKKLLLAIPPTLSNLAPFSPDLQELSVLSKFEYSTVHGGLITHPSLPVQSSLVNIPGSAILPNGSTDYTVLPKPPLFNVRYDSIGGNSTLFRVLMVGQHGTSTSVAQNRVKEDLNRLVAQGTLPAPTPAGAQVQVKAWADHGPMHARVSKWELQHGFMQKLYALQGRRSTWWTGGAFSVNFQAVLWAFDDELLPRLVAGL